MEKLLENILKLLSDHLEKFGRKPSTEDKNKLASVIYKILTKEEETEENINYDYWRSIFSENRSTKNLANYLEEKKEKKFIKEAISLLEKKEIDDKKKFFLLNFIANYLKISKKVGLVKKALSKNSYLTSKIIDYVKNLLNLKDLKISYRNWLGNVSRLKSDDAALEFYLEAINSYEKLKPGEKSFTITSAYLDSLVSAIEIYLKKGEKDEALKYLKKVIGLNLLVESARPNRVVLECPLFQRKSNYHLKILNKEEAESAENEKYIISKLNEVNLVKDGKKLFIPKKVHLLKDDQYVYVLTSSVFNNRLNLEDYLKSAPKKLKILEEIIEWQALLQVIGDRIFDDAKKYDFINSVHVLEKFQKIFNLEFDYDKLKKFFQEINDYLNSPIYKDFWHWHPGGGNPCNWLISKENKDIGKIDWEDNDIRIGVFKPIALVEHFRGNVIQFCPPYKIINFIYQHWKNGLEKAGFKIKEIGKNELKNLFHLGAFERDICVAAFIANKTFHKCGQDPEKLKLDENISKVYDWIEKAYYWASNLKEKKFRDSILKLYKPIFHFVKKNNK